MDKQQLREKLEAELPHHTGAETYTSLRYPWLRSRFLLTDGAKYLAETAKAFWLMDAIASHQNKRVAAESFQVWHLVVRLKDEPVSEPAGEKISAAVRAWAAKAQGCSALLVATNGSDTILTQQEIPYTDFPLPQITLYAEQSGHLGGRVVMLPSEY